MFQYIALLKKEDVKEWIFNEIKELNALNLDSKVLVWDIPNVEM